MNRSAMRNWQHRAAASFSARAMKAPHGAKLQPESSDWKRHFASPDGPSKDHLDTPPFHYASRGE